MRVDFPTVSEKALDAVEQFIQRLAGLPLIDMPIIHRVYYKTDEGELEISIKLERGAKQ